MLCRNILDRWNLSYGIFYYKSSNILPTKACSLRWNRGGHRWILYDFHTSTLGRCGLLEGAPYSISSQSVGVTTRLWPTTGAAKTGLIFPVDPRPEQLFQTNLPIPRRRLKTSMSYKSRNPPATRLLAVIVTLFAEPPPYTS